MTAGQDPQTIAATSTKPNLLVVAPPGCGKTELLAMRADVLISRLVPNQKVLALTFTNRARDNLSERLRRILGVERFRRYVRVRNFHGHATEVVLAHGVTLGLQLDDIQLPKTSTLRKALDRFSSDQGSKKAAAELLAEIKRKPLSDEEVLDKLEAAGDLLAKRVELERVAANQLHYEDLLRHAQRLLKIPEVARLFQAYYGAVLVDEFQDLSIQQLDVAVRSCSHSRTFAGDPLQGIYSWAGAAPKKVEEMLRKGCGEPVQLVVSYRSSPAVLAMVNSIATELGAVPLHAHDPAAWLDGGVSAAIALSTYQQEAEFIAVAAEWIVKADPEVSVGVISRSGWRRKKIDEAFAKRPSVRRRRWDLAIEDPTILERLHTAVAAMPPGITVEEAKAKVLDAIDPSDVDTIEQVDDAFEQLGLAGMTGSMRAALDQFRPSASEVVIGPGVHILNAHTGKGQQFDWVFVCGLEEGHVPDFRSKEGDSLAEEERVLLVMLSRARHGLVVTRSKTRDKWDGPVSIEPSRWWQALEAAAAMNLEQLDAHLESRYPQIETNETA